jgi:hypothetical protein
MSDFLVSSVFDEQNTVSVKHLLQPQYKINSSNIWLKIAQSCSQWSCMHSHQFTNSYIKTTSSFLRSWQSLIFVKKFLQKPKGSLLCLQYVAYSWSLSWTKWSLSTLFNPVYLRSIIVYNPSIYIQVCKVSTFFCSGFLTKILICLSPFMYSS